MFTVSILSQSTRNWRSVVVKTLSEVVQLTHGLETEWTVGVNGGCFLTSLALNGGLQATENKKQYKHALRSLIQRWKAKHFEPVAWFRLSDSALYRVQLNVRLNSAFNQ